MRKMKFIIIGLITISFVLSSCEDKLLEQKPRHTVSYKLFWRNSRDVESALNGMYSLVKRSYKGITKSDVSNSKRWGSWGDYYIYGDMRTGDWINPADNDNDWKNIIKNNLRAFPALQDLHNWRLFYRVIEQANQIIEHVPGIKGNISDEEKKLAVAQARFVRAFIHFHMTRIWGDVPYNTTMENITPLGRIPQKEIWKNCIEELNLAMADLPTVYYRSGTSGTVDDAKTRSMATKGAAYALLSHLYMWNEQYDKAAESVKSIEEIGNYDLLDASQYRNIFDIGSSREIVWEIYYNKEIGEYETYYGSSLTWFFIRPFTTRTKLSVGIPKSKIQEIYHYSGDKRIKEFFMSIDDGNWTIKPGPLDNDENGIMFAKYRKEMNAEYKFDNNVIIWRLAGLYLLRAEAELRNGNAPVALEYLNKVRKRAGIADYTNTDTDNLLLEIIEERRRELVGEYQRFFDLVRLGWVHKYNKFVSAEDEKAGACYWPVSDEAFLQNPEMTQNPFWQ